jgi:hypothetical protein
LTREAQSIANRVLNRIKFRLTGTPKAILAVAQLKDSFACTKCAIAVSIVLVVWLTIVIFVATRHEFWRDEVRALSLARAASSPSGLYGPTQYEGHPILWFLVLYIGKSIVDTPLVLPVASIMIGFSAVAVFMFLSPFPFWFRCLFVFSALPIYEYSVMARNYGISMLLLFVGAVLYRKRLQHPWALAFVLALLANTNVHSAILTCLIAGLWVYGMVVEKGSAVTLRKRRLSSYLPIAIVAAGVALCFVWARPKENSIGTSGLNVVGIRDVAHSCIDALFRVDKTFYDIMPAMVPAVVTAVLCYLAILGLIQSPMLLVMAIGGQLAFGVLFRTVYPGLYRHQGLFLVFLVFLYWLFIEARHSDNTGKRRNVPFKIGLYFAIVMLIGGSVAKTRILWKDVVAEQSSNKALGAFLNGSEAQRDAIIVPEPDYLLESLPYYAKNKIYLARENRFGSSVSLTTEAARRLSLGELLAVARTIKSRYGQPVLIVLGHGDVDKHESGDTKFSYNKVFSWDPSESVDFKNSTTFVRAFAAAYTDENYKIYSVR